MSMWQYWMQEPNLQSVHCSLKPARPHTLCWRHLLAICDKRSARHFHSFSNVIGYPLVMNSLLWILRPILLRWFTMNCLTNMVIFNGKGTRTGEPTISKWDRIYNFYITSNSYGFRESSKSLQVHWSIIVFPMKVAIMARGSPSEWVKLDQLDPCEIETTLTIIQPKRWVRDHHLSIIYILTMVITGNMKNCTPKKIRG